MDKFHVFHQRISFGYIGVYLFIFRTNLYFNRRPRPGSTEHEVKYRKPIHSDPKHRNNKNSTLTISNLKVENLKS